MKSHRLPHAFFMALVAAAAAAPAVALPPTDQAGRPLQPVPVEVVSDDVLADITGKYYGANMLVGLRVDLVSNLSNGQGGTSQAAGSLYVRRTADGFEVQVHSQADAGAGGRSGTSPSGAVASGGEQINVAGIGQITQIAGDDNRMSNIAVIGITDQLDAPTGFNGRSGAEAQAGSMTARVTFAGGGVHIGLGGPGATISQAMTPANGGQVMQIGQIAGNGFVASNTMHLQMMTAVMPSLSIEQLGIQQALAAVSGLRR